MAGNEHIPTAPHEVIGDDGDLRIMRKALREGKHVTLAPDGKVYVSSEAGTPMSEANEAFIESKLGHVIELARSGYGVGVKPDGTIFADRADHLAKVMYDPDPALSEQQRLLLRQGVAEGAHVQVHADGRVEYFRARDAVRPPAEQVSRLQEAIDQQISSGRLLTEMRSGLSLSANPDGSLDYRRVDPGPEPVLFPEDRVILDTVSEFEAEAAELELGAGAARIGGLEDYLHGERAAAGKRDEAGRERAAAEGAAAEAGRQADVAEQRANELSRAETEAWQKAAAAKQAGDTTLAAEATEQANALHVMLITARLEGESAREAEAADRAAAAGHAEQEQRYDDESRAVRRRAKELEDVFDAQEDQAREYRTAATELSEAERLEAALPDLESRGVAGVERIRQAAAEHRRLATEAAERGNAYDQPPALQPEPATPAAPSAPAGPTGPVTKPPPFHDDLRDYSELDDAGDPLDDTPFVDPSEPPTQMSELDVPEIEMPPMDLSADVDDVGDAADVASFGADGVDGVDGGPTAFG